MKSTGDYNMNFKRAILILALVLILFSTVTFVSADRSYSITDSEVDLGVLSNGLLHVEEAYVYNFEGTFNGVYRDIPLKEGESIENIEVSARGAFPVLEQTSEDGKLPGKTSGRFPGNGWQYFQFCLAYP